ncbi:alpha/beta fold hydrolase [Euzebya tangerina]|uniref:alpha/beta fold hydrolase n=1 Tax=Euzebya tangerina TaxID=591198 RepID=UPI0013C35A7A|nr:alpha/beta hydrolase [Euzebya tangerina]
MSKADSIGPQLVLVPGAWMGSWIWDETVARLRVARVGVTSVTLQGLAHDLHDDERSSVTLLDHVRQLMDVVVADGRSVVLVGHSYSGLVVGQVADQLGELVRRSVHVSSFLPRDGRSLIDDWGPDEQAREQERQDILAGDLLWAPPPPGALEHEAALSSQQRRWLSQRFVPHPGRTVLDPAAMSAPITAQDVTFVASSAPGSDPSDDLPPEVVDGLPDGWDVRTMNGGHWPMLSDPDGLAQILIDSATRSANAGA